MSKAKKGQNPHPSTDPGNIEKKNGSSSPSRSDQPAVVFGGTLRDTSGGDAVKAVDSAQPADPTKLWRAKFSVDVLA